MTLHDETAKAWNLITNAINDPDRGITVLANARTIKELIGTNHGNPLPHIQSRYGEIRLRIHDGLCDDELMFI